MNSGALEYEKTAKRLIWIAIGDSIDRLKVRKISRNITREWSVADVRRYRPLVIRGVDDHEPARCGEEVAQIAPIDVVFDKVINHIERQREVGIQEVSDVDRPRRVVPKEGLRIVAFEAFAASIYGGLRYIESEIKGICGQSQLISITTPEFDHAPNGMGGDERVENLGFELRQLAI